MTAIASPVPGKIRILGLSGSLRRQSFNTALLLAAQSLGGDGIEIDRVTLHGIPLYDGDFEQEFGIPKSVEDLKARIMACDALLIATPEYNNSMPGVLKNAIDWLSRPPGDASRIFNNRPLAVIGASPSGFGTVLSQNAWLPVFRTLGCRQWAGDRLMVARADRIFDESGEMTDPKVREQLGEFVKGFANFVRASPVSAHA